MRATRTNTNHLRPPRPETNSEPEIEILTLELHNNDDQLQGQTEAADSPTDENYDENRPLLEGSPEPHTSADQPPNRYGLFCFSQGKAKDWKKVLINFTLLAGSVIGIGLSIKRLRTHTEDDIALEVLGTFPCVIGCAPYDDCLPSQQLYHWDANLFDLTCFRDSAVQNATIILQYLLALPRVLMHSRLQDLGVPMIAPGKINSTAVIQYLLQECAPTNVTGTPCKEPLAPTLNATQAIYQALRHHPWNMGSTAFTQLLPDLNFRFFGRGSVCIYDLLPITCSLDAATQNEFYHLQLKQSLEIVFCILLLSIAPVILAWMISVECGGLFKNSGGERSCLRSCMNLFKAPENLLEEDRNDEASEVVVDREAAVEEERSANTLS